MTYKNVSFRRNRLTSVTRVARHSTSAAIWRRTCWRTQTWNPTTARSTTVIKCSAETAIFAGTSWSTPQVKSVWVNFNHSAFLHATLNLQWFEILRHFAFVTFYRTSRDRNSWTSFRGDDRVSKSTDADKRQPKEPENQHPAKISLQSAYGSTRKAFAGPPCWVQIWWHCQPVLWLADWSVFGQRFRVWNRKRKLVLWTRFIFRVRDENGRGG